MTNYAFIEKISLLSCWSANLRGTGMAGFEGGDENEQWLVGIYTENV
jgi:hypothetical protein